MASRIPGPLGVGANKPVIDKGTAALTDSPVPGPIGTDPVTRRGFCRPCSGNEKSTIAGLGAIPSYSGDFPSPLQVMWYVPGKDEPFRLSISDTEIRQWIKQAADYQGIPHILLAVILQQENPPNGTELQKVLQFGERSVTTFAAIMDDVFFDLVPDKVAGGSSGFANMSRSALQSAAEYSCRRRIR